MHKYVEYGFYMEYLYVKKIEDKLYSNISSLSQFENKVIGIIGCEKNLIIGGIEEIGNGINFISMPSLFLFIVIGFIIRYIMDIFLEEVKIVPNKIQYVVEVFFYVISKLILGQLNKNSNKYFYFLIILFIMLLMFNVLGLIPYVFTITAQIIVTFTLSLGILFSLIIIGFLYKGLRFIFFFFPIGTPPLLGPYIYIIEIISFLSKGFSLGIRLTANMFAGHVLLNIISKGMVYFFFLTFVGSKIIFFIIMCVVIFFFLLESLISFLQAYVFVILSSIYVSEISSLNEH